MGKSAILLRYTKNEFKMDGKTTVGVEFAAKKIHLVEPDKNIKVQIWDTAGQEKFRAITKAYYKGAVGALLVYDITNRSSFENISKWYEEIKTYSEQQNFIVTMLVGNKLDLADNRQVKIEEASQWAENNKIGFVETSALDATNIDHTFQTLVERNALHAPASSEAAFFL